MFLQAARAAVSWGRSFRFPALDLDKFLHQRPPAAVQIAKDGLALRFEPQPLLSLLVGRDSEIGDEFPVMRQHGILAEPVRTLPGLEAKNALCRVGLAVTRRLCGPLRPGKYCSLIADAAARVPGLYQPIAGNFPPN
jgi:hypothetical protein